MDSAARSGGDVELLAPAGDWDCVRAAVANGADAVYFGLPAFNARLRATNFTEDDLPDLMGYLHRHGVRGFVAFNTLIFSRELDAAARQLRLLDRAGVDAIIVQDLGLARMAREVAPRLELHASTQMTITSPEGLAFVDRHFRLDRAVIARENSLREIRLFHATRPDAVALETFVHGALCVAYSGQCLTSESLGQRSANRGECAQACRMPYELVVDGETRELGDKRYLLSPQDLAGHEEIPELIRLGVRSFKIEGRLKTPEYVAAVTRVYRKAIDAALAEAPSPVTERDRYELEMAFSRGLSTGWLRGIDNKKLVHARFGKKRGVFLGTVAAAGRDWVEVEDLGPVQAGDGIVFDTGGDPDREHGGRVFAVRESRIFLVRGKKAAEVRPVPVGARVWKTDDPHLAAGLRASWAAGRFEPVRGQRAVRWRVTGRLGEMLELRDAETGCVVKSAGVLEPASRHPLDRAMLEGQLGRLGGSGFWLAELEVEVEAGVMLPVSELNRMRRALVGLLEETRGSGRRGETEPVPDWRRGMAAAGDKTADTGATEGDGDAELRVLCRTGEQVDAALEEGIALVYADFEDVREYRELVRRFRGEAREGARLFLATPRIQKPGESGLFKVVERAGPDGVLVRNLGGAGYFGDVGFPRIADFSLNVANPLTAAFFMGQGFGNVTVSYDLNAEQVLDLLGAAPPSWFELTVHQHMPMFHMEHCVFCAFLSEGTDVTNCGKPCRRHEVRLRDRVGQEHVLQADVGCRNTLFNGRAQTGARHVPAFLAAGLRRFRVELLGEDGLRTREILRAYRALLRGEAGGDDFWRRLGAVSKLGVTEGTLAV
jgi:putative protease